MQRYSAQSVPSEHLDPRHKRSCFRPRLLAACLLAMAASTGCQSFLPPGTSAPRRGDEIVVAGQFIHTGTRVVLWMDPGGYDAYRVERRFSPYAESNWETSKVAVKE